MVVGITVKTKPLDQVRDSVPVNEVTRDKQVRYNFFISQGRLKALKAIALQREVSVADLVRSAIEECIEGGRERRRMYDDAQK